MVWFPEFLFAYFVALIGSENERMRVNVERVTVSKKRLFSFWLDRLIEPCLLATLGGQDTSKSHPLWRAWI